MLAISLFLVYASQSTARVIREARVARVKMNAEIAYWAAEAGFNRARARLMGGGTCNDMLNLNGTATLYGPSGQASGTYELTVECLDQALGIYRIESKGSYGEPDRYAAERVVAGTVTLKIPGSGSIPRAVVTDYD